ncbi:MAG: tetratricopeptide repeat protein [Crinalium sp.]
MVVSKRKRGRYLTDKGLNKIWTAIYKKFQDGYTLDEISKHTDPGKNPKSRCFVSYDTVSKILNRSGKSDIPYIRSLFTAFELTLEADDYTAEPPASQQQSDLVETNPNFVGRKEDIAHLDTLIHPGVVILLKAPGGTGKTKLAEHYTEKLKNQGYLKLELLMAKDRENITSVESVIEEWLKQDFNEEPGREFGVTLGRLKRLLKERKVCILIDNLEPALDENGKFIQEHRRYAELLRVLADSTVQSITLITSREAVYEGVDIEIYELPKLTPQAWQEFFSIRNINIDTAVLEEMHKAYGGNALAMKVLCDPIIRYHDGNIAAYWQKNKIADDVLCEVAVDNLIKEQFARLEKLDSEVYKLLCRLGCYRYQDVRTVPDEGLLCLLWDVKEEKQRRRVITSLRDRGLVEFQNREYLLHPVIRQEARERLKTTEDWEIAHRKAAEFWTDSIKTVETTKDALTALEAYYHYIEITDVLQAGNVIIKGRDNKWENLEPLGCSLYRLGLSQKNNVVIYGILDTIEPSYCLSRLYNILGDAQWITGNLITAIQYHEESGKIANKCFNYQLDSDISKFQLLRIKGVSLFNIGLCKIDLGEIKEALKLFEEVALFTQKDEYLEFFDTVCDGGYPWTRFAGMEIDCYFCLAFLNSCLGLKDKSLELIEKSQPSKNRFDTWSQGYCLLFTGLTYKNLGELNNSFEMYQKAIFFAEESHYTQVKAKALTGLAEIYRKQEDFPTALLHHSESIKILEKIRAKCDLAEAYYQLALTYQAMGDAENSKINFDKAIDIFDKEIKAPKQVEKVRRAMEGK